MRKNTLKRITALMLALSLLMCFNAGAFGAGETKYSNTQQIANNLTYSNTISTISGVRTESFSLESVPGGDVYPIVMACDTIYGGLTPSQMISYASGMGYNVVAAINTDFFVPATGVPMGIVIENGEYKSSPSGYSALGINADSTAFCAENVQVDIKLTNNGSPDSANTGKTVSLTNFNKTRVDAGGLYLFSSAFSTVSTRSSTDGWFVRFKILEGTMTVSGQMKLEVVEMLESPTAQPIGEGYLILTAATSAGLGGEYSKFAVGDIVTLETTCSDAGLIDAKWATGGGDVLVSEGMITDSGSWDSAISAKHPRTAVGIRADGSMVFYVVDGRSSSSSGLTLQQLAEELQQAGCEYVLNFDGGGSSSLSLKIPGNASTTIVNTPSDKTERKCGTYILFVTNKAANGSAESISLKKDGIIILNGASTQLELVARDSAFNPVSVPADVAVTSALGTVENGVYTAAAAGVDTLAFSADDASGTGSIHVITSPDSIKIKNTATGSTITSATVNPGKTLEITPIAYYLSREVIASATNFEYSVSEDIGTVDENGVFTASAAALGKSGEITIKAGEYTTKLKITISAVFTDTENHWSKDYVAALFENGIVNGTSATTFSPNSNIKRGDFMLMLYNAAGKPAVTATSPFSDVAEGKYYAAAISWAHEVGIALGSGGGKFSPDSSLTREQAFAFVYRAFDVLGISSDETQAAAALEYLLANFTDAAEIEDWAQTPAAMMVNKGIIEGSNGKINPQGKLKRGEMAKILYIALYECK